ncbi:MAG TPA: hypothetical protein VN231_05210, partial [Allosphingosinicella sp.]|nr:hypothetical protein [Allosphingosinicella sp.]
MGDRAEIIGEGRRRIFRSAAAAMLALLAAPAAAQYGVPPPQNVPDAPSRSADSEAAPATQADLLRAASCLAGRDARAGEALLATAPYSQPERQEAVRALRAAERCLRRRGGLATSPL